jgi:hypothetical protein
MTQDRSWMWLNQATYDWQKGLVQFLETTFKGNSRGGTAPCPCSTCCSSVYIAQPEIQRHLLSRGFDDCFIKEVEGVGNDSYDDNAYNDDAPGDGGSITDLVSSLIRGAIHGEIIGTNNEESNECANTFFKLLKKGREGIVSWMQGGN